MVDPGGDTDRIKAAIEKMGAKVEKILLTHGHMDHCAAADVLRKEWQVPIEGPEEGDRFWIDNLPKWCEMSGFPMADAFEPDRWLVDGDTVTVGALELAVIHCPGHTPGHVVFFDGAQQLAWVGDVIFAGSIGRTISKSGFASAWLGKSAWITAARPTKTKSRPLSMASSQASAE